MLIHHTVVHLRNDLSSLRFVNTKTSYSVSVYVVRHDTVDTHQRGGDGGRGCGGGLGWRGGGRGVVDTHWCGGVISSECAYIDQQNLCGIIFGH